MATEVAALLRARNPLIWIVTSEEARVERLLAQAAKAAKYYPRTWDCAQGPAEMSGEKVQFGSPDLDEMMTTIGERARKGNARDVWIMRDPKPWVEGLGGARSLRALRNLVRVLPTIRNESAQALVVITTSDEIPPELVGDATKIEWPLPDREEIAAILDGAVAAIRDETVRAAAAPNGTREAAIDAAVGLSGEEAASVYARSLVLAQRIDPVLVAAEKKRVIAKDGLIEWFDPLPGGLDAVGGLDELKKWLVARRAAYSKAAREYGLPRPKGALLAGIPGCGKSLTAKATATTLQCPLLRLDLGALRSKFVGESEGNLRKALTVVETIGRCVLWLDEVEKALQGSTSDAADGGVAADALGAILNWMQERQGDAFVVATANDASKLPAEFIRKGRFDELWWVDLPNASEAMSVLGAALRSHKRDVSSIDLSAVAQQCEGFTGAEISALVPEAMFAAFADGARPITTGDLVEAAANVVPLSRTAAKRIADLREWARDKARPATAPQATTAVAAGRAVDL